MDQWQDTSNTIFFCTEPTQPLTPRASCHKYSPVSAGTFHIMFGDGSPAVSTKATAAMTSFALDKGLAVSGEGVSFRTPIGEFGPPRFLLALPIPCLSPFPGGGIQQTESLHAINAACCRTCRASRATSPSFLQGHGPFQEGGTSIPHLLPTLLTISRFAAESITEVSFFKDTHSPLAT